MICIPHIHFKKNLSEEDKEFIKEVSKTDLQRQQDKINEAIREKSKLEREIYELKEDISLLHRTLWSLYRYYEEKGGCIPVMLSKPIVQEYTSKEIESTFCEMVNIPIPPIVKGEMINLLNEFSKKYNLESEVN